MTSVRFHPLAFVLPFVGLLLASLPCSAEVGVILAPRADDSQINGVYILSSITEDPDPTTMVWARYNPDGPARKVLNDVGEANGDGKPSAVFNSLSGLPIVAWARNGATGYDVVVSTFADGAWTTPVAVAAGPENELDPFLVVDRDDGTVHLLYRVDDASPRVVHREAPADLSTWSAPVQVSQPGEIAARPAATVHLGDLHVVYEAHTLGPGGTPRQIIHAVRNGPVFDSDLLATTGFDGENRPQIHGALDRLWVDWVDADGEMAWTREVAPETWSPLDVETFTGIEQRDFRVRGTIKALALE